LTCEFLDIEEIEGADVLKINIKITFNEGMKEQWNISKTPKQFEDFQT